MRRLALAAAVLCLAASGASARTGGGGSGLHLRVVASGLASPTYVAAPRGERGRLYIVEQPGRILVLEGGKLREQPFLDIRSLIRSGGEQGLLSVAFHPSYARNHRFYVDYTDTNGDTRVVEYRSDGSRALSGTARQLLFVHQPAANHNGGQLAFGPDGQLYVGMGDGGGAGDTYRNGQTLSGRLAKLLRLDVDRPGARWQIAGYGLRNPWRFSFDRANGDLFIGDVGQNDWEEIDYRPRAAKRLPNYGWSVYEGRVRYSDPPRPLLRRGPLVAPVQVVSHAGGNCSITGGYVYRGSRLPSFRGRYLYGDFCTGIVWSLRVRGGKARDVRRESFTVSQLSSFGEDAVGEVYAVSLDGRVYALTS